MVVVLTVVCGFAYPLVVTLAGQALFGHQADGSRIERDGEIAGSELLGREFDGPGWFVPRPSAAGDGYDVTASSPSNLGPSSPELLKEVDRRAAAYRAAGGPRAARRRSRGRRDRVGLGPRPGDQRPQCRAAGTPRGPGARHPARPRSHID